MDKNQVLKKVEIFVKERLKEEGSGHDWWHIERVRSNALHIGLQEKANIFIIELAALLHDLIDEKLSDYIKLNTSDIELLLQELCVGKEEITEVMSIIQMISFRKQVPINKLSLEGKVVQDADRLDAIGAIGIARTFAYAGSKGHLIYDPESLNASDAIQHFYDKLLKLKDFMNTNTAKKLAEERHDILESYLKQFYKEWNGIESDPVRRV